MPAGTRSVSVFLLNNRKPMSDRPDHGYVFQPELEVGCDIPSSRVLICAAHMPTIGTTGYRTFTMRIPPSMPPATESRPTGNFTRADA